MRVGVVTFPGSNCDADCMHAVQLLDHEAVSLWHADRDLQKIDALILPGGFSYGDYLRCGAIARFAPLVESIVDFAEKGKPILGICNGFQILVEAGLLPGGLLRNRDLKFICKPVTLRVENNQTLFTRKAQKRQLLTMPIAHGDGAYYADSNLLETLKQNQQIVFRYVSTEGRLNEQSNPNGSCESIAGIRNESGNILGMMPHPERAMEALLGGEDGRVIFRSLLEN